MKNKKFLQLLIIILLHFILSGCQKEAKTQSEHSSSLQNQPSLKKLTFTVASDAKNIQPVLAKIEQAYKSIGYKINILQVPADRSLKESLENENIDGELLRSNLIEDQLTGLIRVPVPLLYFRCIPFVKDKNIKINNVDDLKNYTFVTIAGHIALENFISNLEHKTVTTGEQAINMVNEGHVQIALMIDVIANHCIKKFNYDIVAAGPPVLESKIYHYINERHKELLPKLSEALKEQFKVPLNE